MRVAVVAEYYPRAVEPALGIWAHRQAVAARDAGADVRVLVLHRLSPTRAAVRGGRLEEILAPLRQPRRAELDGIPVEYVRYLAPPRSVSYGSWGAWASPSLGRALQRLRRSFPFELVHAHYAAPAGDAVRRSRADTPLVISVHGGDIYAVARQSSAGRRAVQTAFAAARLVIANSHAIEMRCRELGATRTRVVHLGTDLPEVHPGGDRRLLVTVANLVARKRHADVLQALWLLRDLEPDLRWVVVGDGPERARLERLTKELGLGSRVDFRGALPPSAALAIARSGAVFVLPSIEEAFGVAYIEAMAGAVPAIGCRGEPGPEELASLGGGIVLVPPSDPEALAARLHEVLADEDGRRRLGEEARRTVSEHFTWERCGNNTVRAYGDALAA